MQATVSQDELQELMQLVQAFREQTGESLTSIAARAKVDRGQLSQLNAGTYKHAPQFEFVARVAHAIGRRIAFLPEE